MNSHEEVKELLPWFVNGSLNEDEQSIVNRHLESCGECQQDIDQLLMISKEFNVTTDIDDTWDDYIESSTADFMGKLDEPSRKPHTPVQPRTRQPWLWVSSAVACSLIAVAIFLLPVGDVYRTLSNAAPGGVDTPVVQVVFRPEATEQSVRTLLLEGGNEVLSGPTRQGVYRVALGEDQNGDVYVARLRHHPDVIFVQKEVSP